MTNIELVIKVSEEIYKASQIIDVKYEDVIQIPLEVIKNSTPLSKEHGRIIDENKIKNCGWNFIDHHAKTDAPTIIESNEAEYEPPESEE